jgi:hypothetical protein
MTAAVSSALPAFLLGFFTTRRPFVSLEKSPTIAFSSSDFFFSPR